ncbi:MAG: hypothetical protein IJA94_06690 [Bacilli bacterium]|nr:hypothetical protein [Bacilli bacterium]MBQ3415285.1 hypothetical protein [Clostridia bacterium]MBQ4584558.1 hypothetical protein [Bacilli bacterium]MBR0058189.1 hypothetical protein [Methanobrevibacter sp.]MBR0371563.1 hypothetical protein [Methanobrevibacter sp.]
MKYLDLAIANEQIKTTDIKGKDYAEVNQRIKAFRMVYPQGTIETEMLSNHDGVVVFKANVKTEDGKMLATGTAYEKEESSFINKTSYIENCETSAIGRALGIAGFGIDVSVASAEEVQNAIQNQEVTQEEADSYTLTFGKHKGKKLKEVPSEYIDWLLGNTKDERMIKLIELATGIVLPSEEESEQILNKMVEFSQLCDVKMVDRDKIYKHYGVKSNKDMTLEQLEDAIAILKEVK